MITSFITNSVWAQQEKIRIHRSENIIFESPISDIDSLNIKNYNSCLKINQNSNITAIPISGIDSLTFSENTDSAQISKVIYIIYENDTHRIINPLLDSGVLITNTANHIQITTTANMENIEYHISGTTTNGSITLDSDLPCILTLGGASITNANGAAINITSDKDVTILISRYTQNSLSDGSGSSTKAPIYSKGNIIFEDNGYLTVNGLKKHGVCSEKSVTLNSGNITIASAKSDGIHSEGFLMSDGNLNISATGDGIDAGSGLLQIDYGQIEMALSSDDIKGLKTDDSLIVNNGTITITVSGQQSKALKGAAKVIINNGTINITTSGTTVLEASGSGYDTKYCTGITSDYNIVVNGGTITITNTSNNNGGRCMSSDGNIFIYGGNLSLKTQGSGSTYTNESGVTDAYSSSCLKADYGIYLYGGNITCSSTGNGGKGISADTVIIIGQVNADNNNLILNVSTTGSRFYVSGSGDNADYCNPKAVKSDGNLTVNSGTITISCSQEGGEGLESKDSLFINNGLIEITTYDDCVNASNHIQINGGKSYCSAQNNDAFDSNGTLTVTGGFSIGCGTKEPEESFDCDEKTFKITGGILIGTAGKVSNPTTSVCTQNSIKYSATANTAICISNNSGTEILTYLIPSYSNTSGDGGMTPPGGQQGSSMLLFYSNPLLVNGQYTLKTGGTISGGTNFHGYYTDATYSGGSSKTFTISSKVTTIN